MDDPWGSPWADEVQLPRPIKSEDKEAIQQRPTTPTRTATLILQEKTNSPWDDAEDDGFGEWATLPAESGRSLGLDAHADAWEESGPGLTAAPKTDSTVLSLDWNGSQETHVDGNAKLAPSPFLKTADLARQPSPDPWATAFTFNDETTQSTQDKAENEQGHNATSKEEESSEHSLAVDIIPELFNDKLLPDGQNKPEQKAISICDTAKGMDGEDANTSSQIIPDIAPALGNLDGDPASSRPSSSPSEHSLHDELAQESPRTSFDEEPKRPEVARIPSSKVQELVQHFDGLARQDVSDAGASSTSSGQDTVKGGDEPAGEDDDFGDFEEGHSDDEQETVDAEIQPTVEDQAGNDSTNREESISTKSTPRKFVGPVDFDIDTSALEKIYPSIEAESPVEKVFISDTVPYDSFSTTEERKTWYRVSRYGTMRKYNSGDDDYVRINWPQSQIRKDTLKIVARWMEEDRISGRVVLGGGSKGSSIFGWNDKKATPVPLAHALAAKTGKQKVDAVAEVIPEIPREWPQDLAKKSSISRKSPPRTSRGSSMKLSEFSEETKSAVEPPVANFGWNAPPQKSQSLDNHPPTGYILAESRIKHPAPLSNLASPARRSTSVKRPASNGGTAAISSSSSQAPSDSGALDQSMLNAPVIKPPVTNFAPTDPANDDDDWGEMVASPITTAAPPLALSGQTSQLTDNAAGKISDITNTTPSTTEHRSKLSFDNILAPQPADAAKLEKPIIASSTDAFGTPGFNAFTNQSMKPSVPSNTVAADPWATADFSFFETAPAPQSKPSLVTPKVISKSVSFSPSPLAPPRSDRKSREEIEQDRVVQSVVKSLPDLSYMLRR
ncbi:hypothetical protein EG329_010102 [Mollisiaceae sp. DMI_Dod_QoI]|nr:hypothetical protein EG329_010102 [Helotiales sp. DMI_Dod_QoI]